MGTTIGFLAFAGAVVLAGMVAVSAAREEKGVPWKKIGGTLVIGWSIAFVGCFGQVVDDPEVAVTRHWITGEVNGPYYAGFHVVPLVSWTTYSTRRQQVPEGEGSDRVEALTSDQLRLAVEASYWYRIIPDSARQIYVEVGGPEQVYNYTYDAYRDATRDAVSEIAAEDLLSTERQGIGDRVEKIFQGSMSDIGVEVPRYFLRDIIPPQQVRSAIEAKVSRQQEVQTERYQTEIERENARQRRVEAAGIADAQDSIQSTLIGEGGLRYLQWRKYEVLSDVASGENNATWVVPDALLNGVASGILGAGQ